MKGEDFKAILCKKGKAKRKPQRYAGAGYTASDHSLLKSIHKNRTVQIRKEQDRIEERMRNRNPYTQKPL